MKHYHVIYHHIHVLTIADDPQIYISNLASNNENVNPRIYADSGCPFGIFKLLLNQDEFEDTKGAIIIRISKKNRQYKRKSTNGQTTIYKTFT